MRRWFCKIGIHRYCRPCQQVSHRGGEEQVKSHCMYCRTPMFRR